MEKPSEGISRSWIETHHEVVELITQALIKGEERGEKNLADTRREEGGTPELYDLGIEITDQFEIMNKDREWDGEFFDEIEAFTNGILYGTNAVQSCLKG